MNGRQQSVSAAAGRWSYSKWRAQPLVGEWLWGLGYVVVMLLEFIKVWRGHIDHATLNPSSPPLPPSVTDQSPVVTSLPV